MFSTNGMFTRTLRDRFERIEPHVRPPAVVMDLGCVDSRKARHDPADGRAS